jgi:hypothetical protein
MNTANIFSKLSAFDFLKRKTIVSGFTKRAYNYKEGAYLQNGHQNKLSQRKNKSAAS